MFGSDLHQPKIQPNNLKNFNGKISSEPDIPKGQLISKGLFDVIVSKKPKKKLWISALASKKRSDQKNKGTLYH